MRVRGHEWTPMTPGQRYLAAEGRKEPNRVMSAKSPLMARARPAVRHIPHRCANFLVKRHCEDAPIEAAMHADALPDMDDLWYYYRVIGLDSASITIAVAVPLAANMIRAALSISSPIVRRGKVRGSNLT